MIINRITRYFARAPDPAPPEQYYLIETLSEFIPVPAAEGERVRAAVQRFWPPRWVAFRDISGAPYTIRTAMVRSVRRSTAESRARVRAFYRARDREAEPDGDATPWGD